MYSVLVTLGDFNIKVDEFDKTEEANKYAEDLGRRIYVSTCDMGTRKPEIDISGLIGQNR